MQTEYMLASPSDKAHIIDFINYVFSQAHRSHDFKDLLPKVYGDDAPALIPHFLAKQNGEIRGCVAVQPFTMQVLDETLQGGFVGSVSVHLYSRGEGHMIRLMGMLDEYAKEHGYAFLSLGGQKQRYGYYGFDKGGLCTGYHVTKTNLRHTVKEDVSNITLAKPDGETLGFAMKLHDSLPIRCYRDPENFERIGCSWWDGKLWIVMEDGEPIGTYASGAREILLTDEKKLPFVIKAILRDEERDSIDLNAAQWEKERRAILDRICEGSILTPCELIKVYDWEKTLRAFLKVKAFYRKNADFDVTMKIGDTVLRLAAKDGAVTVEKADKWEHCLTAREAQQLFFGLESMDLDGILPAGWLPLPFWMSPCDTF